MTSRFMTENPAHKAVILAAGSGLRTGLPRNKLLFKVGGKMLIAYTLDVFAAHPAIEKIILVAARGDFDLLAPLAEKYRAVLVEGGATRTDSVRCGLNAAGTGGCGVVVIHDGARARVTKDIIDRTIDAAAAYGSGVAAIPMTDSVRVAAGGGTKVLDRSTVYRVQTPQSFRYPEIVQAYAELRGICGDDAEVYERKFGRINLVPGAEENEKITTFADIERFIGANTAVGNGYDIHRLTAGRKLILGGVAIPHSKGLLGHSDADAVLHALMDALLSGAGARYIGHFFPDTDPIYRDMDSAVLLRRVLNTVADKGFSPTGVSVSIIAEKPKLAPYLDAIQTRIAALLGLPVSRVGVTVTTSEKVGLTGREEAVACYAVASLSAQPLEPRGQ